MKGNNKPFLTWATRVAVVVFCLSIPLRARSLTDNHYFTYGLLSWHSRDGRIDFGDGRVQHFGRQWLRTQGMSIGKNFRLPFGFRVALPVLFEFGSVTEGTVEGILLDDGSSPRIHYNSLMYHVGSQPLVQFPLRLADDVWGFGAVGGGIHYVVLSEEERIAGDRNTRIGDPYLERSSTVSASAAIGGGMEFEITKYVVFSVQYLFRFWKPVKRDTARDLFPLEKLPYSERFYTHGISAGILIARHR